MLQAVDNATVFHSYCYSQPQFQFPTKIPQMARPWMQYLFRFISCLQVFFATASLLFLCLYVVPVAVCWMNVMLSSENRNGKMSIVSRTFQLCKGDITIRSEIP